MGLANLVPGISGGTMLVATGIYTRFIDAVSDVTRLRLKPSVLVFLGIVVASAGISIVALAGAITHALDGFRWGMYSLFIGLTLGGAPLLMSMIRRSDGRFGAAAIGGLIAGILVMAGLVVAQATGAEGGQAGSNPVLLILAGIAGASAMILPGVSGAYLLLLIGQYDHILGAIDGLKQAGVDRNLQAAIEQVWILVPVGIGVLAGIAGVSNLLRFVLRRYEKATLGVLLGLLIAAPLGLYPFRVGIAPQAGDVWEGETLTEETAAMVEPKDWPQRLFTPGPVHIAGSVGLVLAGFGATMAIARLGQEKPTRSSAG